MSKVRIYLSGTKYEKEPDMSWKKRLIEKLGTEKFSYFDPIPGTAKGYEVIPRDKREIENADYLVAFINRPTFGTIMEVKHAFDCQNIIILVINPNREYHKDLWLSYHIHTSFNSVEDCAKFISETWFAPADIK